jgi:hypothetical protein
MCDCPTCLHRRKMAARAERLAREDFEMTAIAVAYAAERYRLDDADAARHVRLHAINGPGVMQ